MTIFRLVGVTKEALIKAVRAVVLLYFQEDGLANFSVPCVGFWVTAVPVFSCEAPTSSKPTHKSVHGIGGCCLVDLFQRRLVEGKTE
ncbi:hypothetical protein QKD39_gp21 [Psittacine adenovirus 1]|uniref:Uncharacterized protein n=1 Tax=Psittacine adenovirus 1 TaxID=318592 RepID=A0A2Z5E1A5_9ADEN|nr:hypothetical protein QKD39_gp21 [Psittacine adenovirus 1]AXB73012.1 hypothetical protein [Psittacine adenovirus 1]